MADRYARQTVLAEIGTKGQALLTAARVVIVGCGGLGGPAAAYLAGAGVGTIVLVDGDRPEGTNLHRQVFFTDGDPRPKAEQLAGHCRRLNPEIEVWAAVAYLDGKNVRQFLEAATLVLDCTDDAATKHLLSDACSLLDIPLVYAAAQGYDGYVALFPNQGPEALHLRDLYPDPDPTLPDCATAGVLPTAVGTVALLQANAALCFLLGIGEPPVDRLLTYSALNNRCLTIRLTKNYTLPLTPPWGVSRPARAELEVTETSLTPAGYDGIFSMLTEAQEPELPSGVIRLTKRNPFGQCLEQMEDGKRYLLYCNSGKLSLVLAAQLRKARPAVEVVSLRGGNLSLPSLPTGEG